MCLCAAVRASQRPQLSEPVLQQLQSRHKAQPARMRLLVLVVPALLACTLLPLPQAAAQQQMPFQGRGDNPPASPVDVYATVFVDRVLSVDDRKYEFTAVVWFFLTWRDPHVKDQIAETAAKLADEKANYTCSSPCQSNQKSLAGGCCDNVWMPYIAFSNLKYLPQDRVVRFGFGFDPHGDAVFQWRSVHGTYYTPMDLRAFPFDRQQLLIQMEVPQARNGWSGGLVNLIPSTTGTSLFTAKTRGDDVSGWGVKDVRLNGFSYPLCQATMGGALGPSAAADPFPVMPEYMWEYKDQTSDHATCSDLLLADPARGAKSPFWRHALTNTSTVPTVPVQMSGLNVVILVERFTARWVLSAIFPIMATTWLGFLVFFLPRDDMGGRLGSIVALFLALAAIQFVVDQDVPASSYITPLQQLTLTSYLSLILVGFECVLIWYLTTYHVEKVKMRRHLEAQRNYQARLGAVKAALDAWLVKAQATYRRPPSRSASAKLSTEAVTATAPKSAPNTAGGPAAGAAPGAPAASVGPTAVARPPDQQDGATAIPACKAAVTSEGQQAAAVIAAAPDAPAGEVRLLVSPQKAVGGAAGASSVGFPRGGCGERGGHSAAVQSQESVALADATTQAAIAAAVLAQEEAAAAAGGSAASPRHRGGGLLRFLRLAQQPQEPSPLDPLPVLSAPASTDAAAAADVSAAGRTAAGAAPSSGGGMGQVVHSLLAAHGKQLPQGDNGSSSRQGDAGTRSGAGDARGGDALDSMVQKLEQEGPPPRWHCKLLQRVRLFLESIYSDDAFADRVAHKLNKWCSITLWVAYNLAAVLIFAINSYIFRAN